MTQRLKHDEDDSFSFEEKDHEQQKYLSLLTILKGYEEFILDELGNIVSSNLEAVNITGYEEHEIIGQHISIFYLPEEYDKCLHDLERAKRLKNIFITGLRLKKRNTSFWAKMNIESIFDSNRNFSGYRVTLKDSTHRAINNLRMQSIRDEYLSVFNNPFIGVIKFKFDSSQLIVWNAKAAQVMGLNNRGHENINQYFYDQLEFQKLRSELLRNKRVDDFEFQLLKEGFEKPIWCSMSCRLISSMNFVEGIIADISDKKEQVQELERINQELKVVNSELDKFTYHASHDLRSPITTILGLTNLIRSDKSIERILEYNNMIEDRIQHMDALMKDLVVITSNNQSALHVEPVDFNEMVSLIEKDLSDAGHQIRLSCDIRVRHDFKSDAYRLQTLLRKLVLNSVQYRGGHSATPIDIRLVVRSIPKAVMMLIEDPHLVIAEASHDKVFEMFFRATHRTSGTGLNLYISRNIVHKLGGTIKMKSSGDVGTIFTINIPSISFNSSQHSDIK